MMKTKISTLVAIACLSLSSISAVTAKPNHAPHDEMRILKKLDLSKQQKQDIKMLMQQNRADKKVYAADKDTYKAQTDALMAASTWDEAAAKQLIELQIAQRQNVALSQAKTKHQVFLLLDESQQSKLIEKASNNERNNKRHNKKAKKAKKQLKRMAKKLDLSDEQISQLKSIKAQAKVEMLSMQSEQDAFRQAERAIIQSNEFDESAWLSLQQQYANAMLAQRLVKLKVKYDELAVLTEAQQAKLKERKSRMKEKRDTRGSIL